MFEIEVTDAMREAGAMKFLQVQSLCESEEDAAEVIFRAMVQAVVPPVFIAMVQAGSGADK